jgi:hypothetical protein
LKIKSRSTRSAIQSDYYNFKKMITIGDRESIFSRTFIIPAGEDAKFPVPIGTPEIHVVLRFEELAPEKKAAETSWSLADGVLTIIFRGWKNGLGSSLTKPAKLGMIQDKPFGFNVVHHHLGTINSVSFELYLGGTY